MEFISVFPEKRGIVLVLCNNRIEEDVFGIKDMNENRKLKMFLIIKMVN